MKSRNVLQDFDAMDFEQALHRPEKLDATIVNHRRTLKSLRRSMLLILGLFVAGLVVWAWSLFRSSDSDDSPNPAFGATDPTIIAIEKIERTVRDHWRRSDKNAARSRFVFQTLSIALIIVGSQSIIMGKVENRLNILLLRRAQMVDAGKLPRGIQSGAHG